MFRLYRVAISLLFYLVLPLLLLLVFITGKHREGLHQRFGSYPDLRNKENGSAMTIWLHAASVGEVQAARPIIAELKRKLPAARLVLTVMTQHGKEVAEKQLDDSITCLLAPLDVAGIVDRAIRRICPTVYICIETELWPVLIDALARKNVRLCLINGRLSQRSYQRYKKLGRLVQHTVSRFKKIAVISASDKEKYIKLGARPDSLVVEGNVKYDLAVPPNRDELVAQYKELLCLEAEDVFVAGSTHGNEEAQLAGLVSRLQKHKEILFLIAPRHLRRLEEIIGTFRENGLEPQLLSNLRSGREKRNGKVVIIDTMGELSTLYALGDYVFCGGSLVAKGGHNLMEAAVWDKAVFYGPCIDDFHDAAALLESVRGGFRVAGVEELEHLLRHYRAHPREYRDACLRAGAIAREQQGSSARQLAYVLDDLLDPTSSN